MSFGMYGKINMAGELVVEKYKEIIKMLIILAVLYVVITVFLVPASWIGGRPFLLQILIQLADRMPFGRLIGQFSLYLTTRYLPLTITDQYTYIDVFYSQSSMSIIESIASLCLLGIIYVLINYILSFVFHISEGFSPIRIIERLLVNLIAAIMAIPLATALINMLIVYVSHIDVDWVVFVPYIIAVVSVGGSLITTLLVFSFSTIAMGVLFYILRFVILNALKFLVFDIFAFSLIICLMEGSIAMFFGNYLAIILVFTVIVLMDVLCNKLFIKL